MTLLVSVIVPTYRRNDLLRQCLVALVSQSLTSDEFEIIIADDANLPETRALVEEFSSVEALQPASSVVMGEGSVGGYVSATRTPPVVSLQLPAPAIRYVAMTGNHGPAAARNAGLRAASGEIVAFTDDDCIPAADWLDCGVKAILSGADGVSGRVIVPVPTEPTDYEREQLGLARSEFITANCFYRRSALEAAGGFDERFTLAWREDSDLYFTMLERGYMLVRSPDPVVVHPIRPVRWGESLRQQRKSRFNALCYKKHPQLYTKHFRLRAPWFYYGVWISALISLIGFVSGWHWLAWAGFLAYVSLTGWFTALRLRGTSKAPRHVAEMALTSLVIPFLSIYWRLRGAWHFRVLYF